MTVIVNSDRNMIREQAMKEALTIVMLLLLIVPLLVGVRRIRRLPRPKDKDRE